MIHIFTSVVNRPDFLVIQDDLFKKNLLNKYKFHVIDDSIDKSIELEFKKICIDKDLEYYKCPQIKYSNNPSNVTGSTIQWAYDNIIKENHKKDIVLFLDSDMFLVDKFDVEEYMRNEIISGLPQIRGHVNYIWNGIMFFNMSNMKDKDINFSNGLVDGELTDTGGYTYFYLKRNKNILKETNVQYPTCYNGVDLSKDSSGYGMELHVDGKFLHYRAASNWHSNWRGSKDPLPKKTELFYRIINNISI